MSGNPGDVNYMKNNYTDLRNISDNLNVRPFIQSYREAGRESD